MLSPLSQSATVKHCVVLEKIHAHPMKGHRKFLGGGGEILEAKHEAKLEFLAGRGHAKQKKNLPWEEYGYFLELHIKIIFHPRGVPIHLQNIVYIVLCIVKCCFVSVM